MADAMTEINDAWNQFNELLDSGTQMSILTKIILSTIGIAIMILVEKNYILRRWEGIVAATDASWDDRIFGPLRTRIYIFTIVGGANIGVLWIDSANPGWAETGAPLFNAIFIILAATLASVTVKFILPEILNRFQRQSAVTVSGGNPLLVFLLRAVIWFGGLYLALSELGIELFGVLASLAVFSLIIGLAIQQTLGNIVNSFMLALDRPFEVGDRIEVDGVMGTVMSIGILSTKLLTLKEELVVIPNNSLVDSTVTNYARGGGDGVARRISVQMDYGVAYDEDPAHVKQVMLRVARSCQYVLSEPRPRVMMTELGDFAKVFRLFIWIGDYNDEIVTRDYLIERMDRAFEREGIVIPYPTAIEMATQEVHPDPEVAAKKLQDKEVRRQRAVASYRLEEARLRKEHSKITAELEDLYSKVKSGKVTGKELADMQDRIRELEQSLALDMDLDD
ncbi:MAG: mechanosensitive ion channel family protein [Candidatus Thermoplasmatota archaeon]|nr:mechanosensitive ion channel family protein [Candidatus Thermoplasmatota archaeon]MEC7687898.1 mechanosensitive ion channel family protein [Candidatus Thermoplasmatota archaeon]MEC8384932.1 mechanosensitive ion channel family protein [Candidatus Thermoplasmatota archaeon]